MIERNPYAPPQADVEPVAVETPAAPSLWNPNAAASWSLIFTPIFGAILHMKNWEALGEPQKAAGARSWASHSWRPWASCWSSLSSALPLGGPSKVRLPTDDAEQIRRIERE